TPEQAYQRSTACENPKGSLKNLRAKMEA
ncbi:uncharacterized, partial [Tachysurus ichikawai]